MTRSKGKEAVKTRRANEERVRDRERLREREKEWGGGERHHQNNYNKVHASSIMPRTHLLLQLRNVGAKLLDAGIKRFALIE